MTLLVQFPIKLHESFRAIFVFFGGNDRLHVQLQQVFVDPIRTIPFVAAQGDGPSEWLVGAIV